MGAKFLFVEVKFLLCASFEWACAFFCEIIGISCGTEIQKFPLVWPWCILRPRNTITSPFLRALAWQWRVGSAGVAGVLGLPAKPIIFWKRAVFFFARKRETKKGWVFFPVFWGCFCALGGCFCALGCVLCLSRVSAIFFRFFKIEGTPHRNGEFPLCFGANSLPVSAGRNEDSAKILGFWHFFVSRNPQESSPRIFLSGLYVPHSQWG